MAIKLKQAKNCAIAQFFRHTKEIIALRLRGDDGGGGGDEAFFGIRRVNE